MNIHPKEHKWFFSEWQPALDKAMPSGRKVAIIPAKNLFSELAVKTENQHLEKLGNPTVKYFSSCEDVKKYLLHA
ncbi:MAG: hypothetical protein RMJ87_10680 [Cytophagales bacterium]|nr:hypothetical protein [Bernardetiaceae bacterium]MDW8205484.1 hypothetical protein [Cytophagales bacterium]